MGNCLCCRPRHKQSTIEVMIKESEGLPIYLPGLELLKDSVRRAVDWKAKANTVLKMPELPTLDQLKALVARANAIPVRLELVDQVV